MDKIFCWTLIFIILAGVAKSVNDENQERIKKVNDKIVKPIEESIYTDPETGCQYITRYQGITPRLGTDGFPLCENSIAVNL